MDPRRLESFLADEVFAASVVPIACPSVFGVSERYEMLEMIAQGTRSWVYHARDRHFGLNADVAIKLFRPGTKADEGLLGRQVRHTNVIHTLDRGTDPGSGFEYLVTDYASNGTLADVRVPVQVEQAVCTVIDLARAAHAAHQAGIVHCDIKPQNVLVDAQGIYKLADFELAHNVHGGKPAALAGTPAFMAPEQWRQDSFSATPAADTYALGGILYWLLSGLYPNGSSKPEAEALAHGRVQRPPLQAPWVILRIMERALAPDATKRFESAAAMAQDLERWLRHEPIAWLDPSISTRAVLWARRRPWRVALVGVAAVTFTIGGVAVLQVHNAKLAADVRAQVLAEQEATRRFDERAKSVRQDLGDEYSNLFNLRHDRQMSQDGQEALIGGLVDPSVIPKDVGALEQQAIEERVGQLQTVLDHGKEQGLDGSMYFLNLRICLATDLLILNRDAEVQELLKAVRAQLLPRASPDDPMQTAITMMELATRLREGHMDDRSQIEVLDKVLRPTRTFPNVRRAVWHRVQFPASEPP